MARSRRPSTVAEYVRWVASQGGQGRRRALSDKERSEAARKAIAARWRKTTKAERSAAARKAALARWSKKK